MLKLLCWAATAQRRSGAQDGELAGDLLELLSKPPAAQGKNFVSKPAAYLDALLPGTLPEPPALLCHAGT